MTTKSRERIYGSAIRASAERAREARRRADVLACEAWNFRMLGYKGPAQPSPTIGDALNASYGYLEVRCLGCDTSQTVASTLCCDRGQPRSINWNGTCAARTALKSEAIPTSGAIWSRCASAKYPRAIRHRRFGRANGESKQHADEP